MRWFGFGFNAFGQIYVEDVEGERSDAVTEVKVSSPTELRCQVDQSDSCLKTVCQIRASWSRRASLHLDSKSIRYKTARVDTIIKGALCNIFTGCEQTKQFLMQETVVCRS